uniref:FWP009 n=1 Tax=Homo sapiens TaxID=9606 RepID=Q5QTR7_HUMAN|nr:FWP009 [Homo sapiens]
MTKETARAPCTSKCPCRWAEGCMGMQVPCISWYLSAFPLAAPPTRGRFLLDCKCLFSLDSALTAPPPGRPSRTSSSGSSSSDPTGTPDLNLFPGSRACSPSQ